MVGEPAESSQNPLSFGQYLHLFSSDIYFFVYKQEQLLRKNSYILPCLFFLTKHVMMKKIAAQIYIYVLIYKHITCINMYICMYAYIHT